MTTEDLLAVDLTKLSKEELLVMEKMLLARRQQLVGIIDVLKGNMVDQKFGYEHRPAVQKPHKHAVGFTRSCRARTRLTDYKSVII